MSVWSDFYQGRVGPGYARYCRDRYLPFLEELRIGPDKLLREEGCGIGTISRILMQEGYRNLEMFDLCPEQLKLASANTMGVVPAYVGDILGYHHPVDLIFSHGVIEHFGDEQIELILHRQKQTAPKVVHYVPTDGYDTPSFGDERLMSVQWWVDKWKPTTHKVFNDGKDLVLIWEQK